MWFFRRAANSATPTGRRRRPARHRLSFSARRFTTPRRPLGLPAPERTTVGNDTATVEALATAGRESIRRGLAFLESAIDDNGAWHCIRFNTADPDIPRHYERPAFVSALCVLALECCDDPRAKEIRSATESYLVDTVEHPGFWRYYRHLPQDLDSSALCSLAVGTTRGSCWDETFRKCWRTATRRAVS